MESLFWLCPQVCGKMGLFAVKTTKSQEETVADMIISRELSDVHAALAPEEMSSYVVVEAEAAGIVERAVDEIPHAQKVVQGGGMSMSEIEHFLEETSDVEGVSEGDVVRITNGPYQGEKAQVQRVDDSKEQVTVNLYEATVPIPVTIRGDQVRVLDSEERKTARDA